MDRSNVGRAVPDGRAQPVLLASPGKPKADVSNFSAVLASLLILAFALFQGLATKNGRDFFIYRLGAELAVRGENPYNLAKIRQHVAEYYSEDDDNTKQFVANCGYFLPPLAIVLFLPLAATPVIVAKVFWALAIGVAGFFVAHLPAVLRSKDSPPLAILPRTVVPFLLVLNPLTLSAILVGQTSFLSLGCFASGLLCIDRGRPNLAAILWVLPFLKPHVALPLIPLLWFLAGWRPAVLLLVLTVLLNLIGATLVGGSPLSIEEYLEFLPQSHKTIAFNRVETNPRITSWNCLLFRARGPLIELGLATTLAGYLVWFGLAIGRVALSGTRPSITWAIAVAAVGAVLCSQVLVYELLILGLVVPWVRDLLANSYRLLGWLAVGLLSTQVIPGMPIPPSLGVVGLAVLVMAGPEGGKPTAVSRQATQTKV